MRWPIICLSLGNRYHSWDKPSWTQPFVLLVTCYIHLYSNLAGAQVGEGKGRGQGRAGRPFIKNLVTVKRHDERSVLDSQVSAKRKAKQDSAFSRGTMLFHRTQGHFTHETESPSPVHFKHSHWWKDGAGPSSLHTTPEGPTEYVNARWM